MAYLSACSESQFEEIIIKVIIARRLSYYEKMVACRLPGTAKSSFVRQRLLLNDIRFNKSFRMKKETFLLLHTELVDG